MLASLHRSLAAAILSAVAAFFIAMTQILNFGARWTTSLDRRARYATLIYDLNALPLKHERGAWPAEVAKLVDRLKTERLRDGLIPGAPATPRGFGTDQPQPPTA